MLKYLRNNLGLIELIVAIIAVLVAILCWLVKPESFFTWVHLHFSSWLFTPTPIPLWLLVIAVPIIAKSTIQYNRWASGRRSSFISLKRDGVEWIVTEGLELVHTPRCGKCSLQMNSALSRNPNEQLWICRECKRTFSWDWAVKGDLYADIADRINADLLKQKRPIQIGRGRDHERFL